MKLVTTEMTTQTPPTLNIPTLLSVIFMSQLNVPKVQTFHPLSVQAKVYGLPFSPGRLSRYVIHNDGYNSVDHIHNQAWIPRAYLIFPNLIKSAVDIRDRVLWVVYILEWFQCTSKWWSVLGMVSVGTRVWPCHRHDHHNDTTSNYITKLQISSQGFASSYVAVTGMISEFQSHLSHSSYSRKTHTYDPGPW